MKASLILIRKKFLTDVHINVNGRSGQFADNTKRLDIILFFLLFLGGMFFMQTVTASPNELKSRYNMYLLGANIGEFSVKQTGEKGNLTIEAITEVNVNMVFSYRIKYVQNTVYNNGVLQSSHVLTYKNGKLNSDVWLKLQHNSYLLIAGKDTTIINDLITYSGSLIYFNEPTGINRIFKERSAEIEFVSRLDEDVFTVKDEKGREVNRYFYKDGILQRAEMRHALGTVELKRIIG